MKIKDLPVSIKAGPDDGLAEGQFTAYASVFGNVDYGNDVVTKGAFTGTLDQWFKSDNALPLLWGHNTQDPDYNIGHVVSATEDDHGLLVTAQLDLEQAKAVQTYRLLKGRRVNQMSFAYDVVNAPQKDDSGANVLSELKLHEVSVVPMGMNAETEILAVKALAEVGRVDPAACEDDLRTAYKAIGDVLVALDNKDTQEQASGTGPVNDAAASDEPSRNPSVRNWATHLSILALSN